MNSQTASLFLDGLVDQAIGTDDYAFIGTLHVLRDACETAGDDSDRIGAICRAAEYVSEARVECKPSRTAEPSRALPGARVRLRSRRT